jgi:hypothetical protein
MPAKPDLLAVTLWRPALTVTGEAKGVVPTTVSSILTSAPLSGGHETHECHAPLQRLDVRRHRGTTVGRHEFQAIGEVFLKRSERTGVVVQLIPTLADVIEDAEVRRNRIRALELDERRAPVSVFRQLHAAVKVPGGLLTGAVVFRGLRRRHTERKSQRHRKGGANRAAVKKCH